MSQPARIALTRELAEWFRMDRGDVSRTLESAGIKPVRVGGKGGGNGFPIEAATPALLSHKLGKLSGQSSSDERNLAQAEKLRLETAILRREHIPVDEAVAMNRKVITRLAELVQNSELSNEASARFIDDARKTLNEICNEHEHGE